MTLNPRTPTSNVSVTVKGRSRSNSQPSQVEVVPLQPKLSMQPAHSLSIFDQRSLKPSYPNYPPPHQVLKPVNKNAFLHSPQTHVASHSAPQSLSNSPKPRPRTPPQAPEPDTLAQNFSFLASLNTQVPRLLSGQRDLAGEIVLYASLCQPDPTLLDARRTLIDLIAQVINTSPVTRRRGGRTYEIAVFGSARFGLDSCASDLDLCLLDPDRRAGPLEEPTPGKLPRVYHMRRLAGVLAGAGFRSVQPIPAARTPIVKFRSPDGRLAVDMNTNNLLGVRNSALLAAYYGLAPHLLRPLGMAVKMWAKGRGYADPAASKGPTSASSYTLVLLLIGYLQTTGQLPNLQQTDSLGEPHYVHTPVDAPVKQRPGAALQPRPTIAIDTAFIDKPPSCWTLTEADLAQTLLGFFRYYDEFDFNRMIVSIRDGRPCPREKARASPASEDEDTITYVPFTIRQGQSEAAQRAMDAKLLERAADEGGGDGNQKTKQEEQQLLKVGGVMGRKNPTPRRWLQPIVVVDPFLITRNTAGNIQPATAAKIRSEFKRARMILERGGGLAEICEERIIKGTTNSGGGGRGRGARGAVKKGGVRREAGGGGPKEGERKGRGEGA